MGLQSIPNGKTSPQKFDPAPIFAKIHPTMLKSSLSRLRLVSLAEGISFLVLLYFAIYHKRILGEPDAIKVPGMIHGVLFLLFIVVLLNVWVDQRWSVKKAAFAFLCSLIPFAPFYLERKLKEEEKVLVDAKLSA